jgi:2,3-bisphosphoglycerate-dependent phosphoglycerate mutase
MSLKTGIYGMSPFYLIRHAHADYSSDEQRPLSLKGQADAERVAEVLCRYPITQIYSSPFQRALQTVNPLAKKLNLAISVEPDLRERCLGHGPENEDFISMVEQAWQDPDFLFQGGESNKAAQKRGVRIMRKLSLRHPAEHMVLSTHGNLMCLILQSFDGSINYAFWKALSMPDIYSFGSKKEEISITRLWQP